MKSRKLFSISTLVLLTALYCVIYGAVNYNVAMTTAALAERPVTVVIDAGHGGEDGGAASASGVKESQINLSIALRLEQLLAFCGFQTQMIRQTDTAVYTGDCDTITEKKVSDLKNRVETVNAVSPAILISIHQNHFSEEKYDGAQVFYAGTQGSRALAELTQSSLREALDPSNRRQAKLSQSVYLMEHIQCTGILVECGFLSNRQEALRLQEEAYQKKLACAIGSALAQYTEEGETELEI